MSTDELEQLDQWAQEFEDFQARFAPLFARSEPRAAARRYVRGLLAPVARKNCWQLAEVVGEKDPQALQRLLYSAHWAADEARDELQRFVIEEFGDPGGIVVIDETGFLKKGTQSGRYCHPACARALSLFDYTHVGRSYGMACDLAETPSLGIQSSHHLYTK